MNNSDETPNVLVRLKYYPPGGGNGAYYDRRSFYASGGADDYLKYIEKGIDGDEISFKPKRDYMDYVGSDTKSAGVFSKNGKLSKEQKAELRRQLRTTGSNVWDMVISFKEGYGDKYMRDMKSAQELLKAQLNRFFKGAGFSPNNMIWFAGLHTNTDNRHLHVCFFEREPTFLRRGKEGKHFHHGKLRQFGIDAFKFSIEEYFSDMTMQLKTDRAELIAVSRESINYDKQLKKKVAALADLLPPTGTLGYDNENMKPLRPIIDGITEHIIKHYAPAGKAWLKLSTDLSKRDAEIIESCRKQKIKNVGAFHVKDKVLADLNRRIGNQIIGFAFNVKKSKEKDKRTRADSVSPNKRRAVRREFLQSLTKCLKLKAIAEEECMRDFEDYLRRLEVATPESEYERQRQSEME